MSALSVIANAFRNELRRVLNRGEAVNALKRADEMQAVLDRWSNRRQVIPPELIDLLSGQVPVMFENIITVVPHIKAGSLRALADPS